MTTQACSPTAFVRSSALPSCQALVRDRAAFLLCDALDVASSAHGLRLCVGAGLISLHTPHQHGCGHYDSDHRRQDQGNYQRSPGIPHRSPRIMPLTIAIGFQGAAWSVPRWMPAHTLPPITATKPAMSTAGRSSSEADGIFHRPGYSSVCLSIARRTPSPIPPHAFSYAPVGVMS